MVNPRDIASNAEGEKKKEEKTHKFQASQQTYKVCNMSNKQIPSSEEEQEAVIELLPQHCLPVPSKMERQLVSC